MSRYVAVGTAWLSGVCAFIKVAKAGHVRLIPKPDRTSNWQYPTLDCKDNKLEGFT